MPSQTLHLTGRGIYSLAEAHRITRIPTRRIVRWTRGYTFEYKGQSRFSPAIIAVDMVPVDGQPVLSFGDLIEIRFLNSFRVHGVGWKAIRIAAQRAKELLQLTHPFSSKVFKTDGRTILADFVAETGDKVLLDLVRNQYAFAKVISKYLYGGIEFNTSDEPQRWYPLEKRRTIVIDPERGFGAPIIAQAGIPTRIIYQSFGTMKNPQAVARWYEIPATLVRDAIRFEQNLVN